MSDIVFLLGALPFAFLGIAHLALTVQDLRAPTNFTPVDAALVAQLKETKVVLTSKAPVARSMWDTWLGVNLTHSLGLIIFALFPGMIALHDSNLLHEIALVRPFSILIALVYAIVAFRFLFLPAGIVATLGLGFLVAGTLL